MQACWRVLENSPHRVHVGTPPRQRPVLTASLHAAAAVLLCPGGLPLQEASESLAAGKSVATPSRDQTHPLGPKARAVVQTTIEVRESPNGSCSILYVVTTDRPGLLVDIVSVLKDINVNVVSAEIETIGDEARDEFFVTYHGEPLNGPMVQLVTNSLQVRAAAAAAVVGGDCFCRTGSGL